MTTDQLIAKFNKYASIWRNRRRVIPAHIRNNVLFSINMTDSIDTGRFLRAVSFREQSLGAGSYRFLIDAKRDKEVTYDLVVERGRKDGQPYPPGRFNYKRGIEATDFRRVSDAFANEAFRGF